ncbi:unnamed protein product, partial [Protopolystoma xenopodis]
MRVPIRLVCLCTYCQSEEAPGTRTRRFERPGKEGWVGGCSNFGLSEPWYPDRPQLNMLARMSCARMRSRSRGSVAGSRLA